MFDIPDAKRVKRDELYDSEPEERLSERDPEDAEVRRAELNARLSDLISLDFGSAASDVENAASGEDFHEQEPEFDFRLFSSSKGPSTKVVLTTVEEDVMASSEGTILSKRPRSFYIRGELSPDERMRLSYCAVSGRDVIRGSKERAWGLEVPWRVYKITTQLGPSTLAAHSRPALELESTAGRKKRPGKKRRIALRVKDKARREKEQAEAEKKLTKEEHLREKKKRLNREKKLKRRAKEREKKASQPGDTGVDAGAFSGSEA